MLDNNEAIAGSGRKVMNAVTAEWRSMPKSINPETGASRNGLPIGNTEIHWSKI